ncbi:hypothetical protein TSUD_413390 [Trifolium subterraneum]|uniref:Disease resistance protein At4g27190-like leucine-rich repeats domain-containing protein n=1 Tax=Trifolium subterraneum TaxID=3900 RepID=A0A2Z6PUF8_TRISU|nr:hypothetical protein TSUD_413390 [Trifolium subterraneum]
MKQIQILEVTDCGIEEIVGREEGVEEIVKFVFPNLTFIILNSLAKLKTFFAGVHSLQCKSLKTIDFFGCPKIELFKAEPLRQQESTINDKLNISTYLPLFMIEEVFNTVETLIMSSKYFDMILHSQYSGIQFNKVKYIGVTECYNEEATFPCWFLKNVPNLESILIGLSSSREIFPGEQLISTEKETQIIPRLKELNCRYMYNIQCICKEGLQMDPILQLLERINVHCCSSLVKFVPSSVTFNYLTYLEVTECNGLINLITYSTAKSLVKLTTMKIEMCNWLEDIVNGKEEDDETKYKIEFCSLKSLELISLPRLCVFSSCPCLIMFPLLEDVVVKECPRMEYFSLGVINTIDVQHIQIDEENHWEGDLNRTIKKMFDDKVAFNKLNCLALSDYPELKDLWYGQLNHNMFCNLKSLVVQKCDFLSHVLLPSNVMQALHGLEELEVTDCDSLEAVFDVKEMEEGSVEISFNFPQLNTLVLYLLTNLETFYRGKHALECPSLKIFNVYRCEALRMFSFTHLDFQQPYAAGRNPIIPQQVLFSIEKINEEKAEENIIFENLEYLELSSLSSFRSFCYGKQAFIFPSFLRFFVDGCPQMKIFSSGVTVAPYLTRIIVEEGKMRWKGDLNTTIEQLFIEQEISHSNVE